MKEKIGIGFMFSSDEKRFLHSSIFSSLVYATNNLNVKFFVFESIGHQIDQQRNEVVENAIVEGCEKLIMIDSDMVLPLDAIEKMISKCDGKERHMVSGLFFRRYEPYDVLAFYCEKEKDVMTVKHMTEKDMKSEKLIQVDFVGTGCFCVHTNIFSSLNAPHFYSDKSIGEDVYFCNNMNKYGFNIFVDTSIKVGHIFYGIKFPQ